MSISEYVNEALKPFSTYQESHGAVAVTTPCLYPSNAMVTVFVRGGPNGAIVSDDGRAIDELTVLNREISDVDRFLSRVCWRSGMNARNGKIYSPRIEWRQLPAAIAFVAQASATAVTIGLQRFKTRRNRDLHKELRNLLFQSFSEDRIQKDSRLTGHSTRSYSFDNIVQVSAHLLIVDPVVNDPNSINARAIAHLDVSRKQDDSIIQHLVYDDTVEWKAADLNLLQTAATIVPFSNLEPVMREFARQ